MRTMAFKRLADFLSDADLWIVVHGKQNPGEEEWKRYIEAMGAAATSSKQRMERLPTLVLSDGGGPNAIQRAAVNDLQERHGNTARVAFVSDSPLIRGVTRTMTWFNPKFRAFSPQGLPDALDHLGVPAPKRDLVRSMILELEQELGGPKLEAVRAIFGRKGPAPRGP